MRDRADRPCGLEYEVIGAALFKLVRAVPTARPAAVSSLSEVGSGQHEQSRVGIDVAGLAPPLRGIVCALHLGIDVHQGHIIQQADASRDGSACDELSSDSYAG